MFTSRRATIPHAAAARQLQMTISLLFIVCASADVTLDSALDYAWTTAKVLFACSPILLIFAVLLFAREDEEAKSAKRKVKCARS